jgi:ubiquinol-cytochrome c reductase cytochrome c subunit
VTRRGSLEGLAVATCGLMIATLGVLMFAGQAGAGPSSADAASAAGAGLGRALFLRDCSSCHGFHARGIHGTAPSLVGVGALAADFELSTGRMPLPAPGVEPVRGTPAFDTREQRALVAYIGSLGGPGVPHVSTRGSSISAGRTAFQQSCAGCHTITAAGGVIPGASVPGLQQATAVQVAEAVRLGPYLMPRFGTSQISPRKLDAITAYVVSTQNPDDAGGWGIGHLGPVPEGMVAWLIGLASLLVVARLAGEREP